MSYSVGANNVLQLTLRGTLFGQTMMNTFHWQQRSAGGTFTDAAAFLSDFNDDLSIADTFYDQWRTCVPALMVNIFADLQWIYPDRFVKRTFVLFPVGGAAHVPTTANLASVITLRGDIASKRSIGDKHLPGLGGNAIALGQVTAGQIAQMEEFGARAIQPVTVGGHVMEPIIFGRPRPEYTDRHGVVHPALPASYIRVTQWISQTTARVMRRRTVGVGI